MATKDEKPGLLSKVAMFVRNPTRDWSELDQPQDTESSGYDKQALKAMIERKRQNDFVRKREFDQLRKLRNRDPATLASMARPSFFQSSVSTDIDDRAVTLKKIDEIEAQMSRQWWKARSQDSQSASSVAPSSMGSKDDAADSAKEESKPALEASDMSFAFASTEVMDKAGDDDGEVNEFMPTQMTVDDSAQPSSQSDRDSRAPAGDGSLASTLLDFDEMATDPELEEAAIRFANGDVAGAEGGLLTALRGRDLELQAAQSWAAALLDLYRATGNREAFDVAANEFALHLDGVWPVWSAASGAGAPAPTAQTAAPAHPVWSCQPALTAAGMETLRTALVGSPMPWYLDWRALQTIEPEAMPLLGALFESLCSEPVTLRIDGQEPLLQALRAMTPSGESDKANPAWWKVRLDALRALGMQDDFELAALDYCVTFEAAPPEWTGAACRVVSEAEAQAGVPVGHAAESYALQLSGEILGDALQALSQLDYAPAHTRLLAVDCGGLVRVDFAAAGSILNWVTARQGEGKQVQFQNVHRLVAAFFNVIGINEYAKVIPRSV